tara:strand:+ start:38 stop:244 length:207 start_codon:yes stop_codon:yes gene_type:complete
MFDYFGKFDSIEDLESRMVNTFAEDPIRFLQILAKQIICEDMKITKNPEGGITVFWNTAGGEESYKWN